jgi:hypothetical protein
LRWLLGHFLGVNAVGLLSRAHDGDGWGLRIRVAAANALIAEARSEDEGDLKRASAAPGPDREPKVVAVSEEREGLLDPKLARRIFISEGELARLSLFDPERGVFYRNGIRRRLEYPIELSLRASERKRTAELLDDFTFLRNELQGAPIGPQQNLSIRAMVNIPASRDGAAIMEDGRPKRGLNTDLALGDGGGRRCFRSLGRCLGFVCRASGSSGWLLRWGRLQRRGSEEVVPERQDRRREDEGQKDALLHRDLTSPGIEDDPRGGPAEEPDHTPLGGRGGSGAGVVTPSRRRARIRSARWLRQHIPSSSA